MKNSPRNNHVIFTLSFLINPIQAKAKIETSIIMQIVGLLMMNSGIPVARTSQKVLSTSGFMTGDNAIVDRSN